jgi:hypothetical protein
MTAQILIHFDYSHLGPARQAVSKPFHDMAHTIEREIADGPEKTVGLRKLLEAKDCIVRASIELTRAEEAAIQEGIQASKEGCTSVLDFADPEWEGLDDDDDVEDDDEPHSSDIRDMRADELTLGYEILIHRWRPITRVAWSGNRVTVETDTAGAHWVYPADALVAVRLKRP